MEFKAEDALIYKTVVGSTAYGLNTPTSDVDTKGICIPPLDYYFGNKVFEQQENSADDVIYSLKKFVHLAQDCNPNIIEMLWVDDKDILFCNHYGEILKNCREIFLSKKVKHTFSGYAFAQLQRIKGHYKWIMYKESEPKSENYFVTKYRTDSNGTSIRYQAFNENQYNLDLKKWNQYLDWKKNRNEDRAELEEKYGYDTKHAMHLVRLLRMGKEILTEGKVFVKRPDAQELMDIRNGKWSYEKLIQYAEDLDKELTGLYESSPLPKYPDVKKINNLLVNLHHHYFLGENIYG